MTASVWTAKPDGTDLRYLAEYGPVSDLVYSDTRPGGAEQLTCTVGMDPARRPQALDVGRRVVAVAGASIQWEGTLNEAVPNEAGFDLTADGAGTWGSRYRDYWADFNTTNVIDRAIIRGLRWIRGDLSGSFMDQVADPASQTVTEYLNAVSSPANKMWQVTRNPSGLQVDIVAIPDPSGPPTRILVAPAPAARTVAGYVNVITIKYTSSADSSGSPASYDYISRVNQASIDKHDRTEAYWDLSDAGVLSTTTVISYGDAALSKYVAATWGGPYEVTYGEYMNAGGAPVDLACEKAGEVVRVIFADGPYGGEVAPAPPVQFVVGKVEYRDADRSAKITPMQAWNADFQGLLEAIAPKAPA